MTKDEIINLIQSELNRKDEERSDETENLIFRELQTTFKMPLDKIDEFSLLRMNSEERLKFALNKAVLID
jgi:hypothetical protein